MTESALVLLSGGQDSTTVFHYARRAYSRVEAISFDYGQRHAIELDLAEATAKRHHVPWAVLPVEALKVMGAASLTNPQIPNTPGGEVAADGWHSRHGLPPSFVPGRNVLFFALAAAYGIPRDLDVIVTGVCQQDEAGYPDCREAFVDNMEQALRFGMDTPRFEIDAPLLHLSKAQTFRMADQLGVLDEIIEHTNTCYEGDRRILHTWGYGCGICGACVERRKGWDEYIETKEAAGVRGT